MSVTVAKGKEVTAVAITAGDKSMFPPLCRVLRALRYSPISRAVRSGLMQTSGTAALGTIQILVGLFNVGLGPGRTSTRPGDLTDLGAAYWLGAVYIIAGIISLIAGQFPFLCLVGFTAFVNIVGSVFGIVGVVLYAIDLGEASPAWMCNRHSVGNDDDSCVYVAYFAQKLLTGMDATSIVLAVLEVCVCTSVAALCIRALVSREKVEVGGDFHQPMLKEAMTSPGA